MSSLVRDVVLRRVPAAAAVVVALLVVAPVLWLPGPALAEQSARWHAPLPGTLRVVRVFTAPPQPWLPGHRGVDLAATHGEAVLAAGDGVVLFAARVAGRGVVSVRH